ncbi:hypothetical protein LTR22_026514 [Elasticomyces elasticus]|nr:hypothetical protein LTR22_026514 [Elasticomyces elasticus]KAK4907946.1 hypothetical protein LTR49_023095 [Elasticomyces elasticus]KAK5748128.1 hypothetical protein LTS12_021820 [Elasticomyces elasticus]
MSKPRIVLLSLEKRPHFDKMYTHLLTALKAKADVEMIEEPSEARQAFGCGTKAKPQAILVTDGALLASTRISLVQEAASYARDGGTLVFMGDFASSARSSDIENLFDTLELPWASGDYHRTTSNVNRDVKHLDTSVLVPSYSQKALYLQNVASNDAVYLPSGAPTQSIVFESRAVDTTQSPTVYGATGGGKVGYIGDVNAEDESTPVVLLMCGV